MVSGQAKKWNILTPGSVSNYTDLLNLTLDYLPPDVRETAEVNFELLSNYYKKENFPNLVIKGFMQELLEKPMDP